jgi:DNA-binding response OmpR family regulator
MVQSLAIDHWDLTEPLPGREGTLLAMVPVPGTETVLAIVGYAVPASGARSATGPWRLPQSSPPLEPRADSGLVLDRLQRRVWADGTEVLLTYLEFELLAFLAANPGKVFSRTELLSVVWSQETHIAGERGRTVDVHVSRLRRKLGSAYGQCLITEFRIGYQFRPPTGS